MILFFRKKVYTLIEDFWKIQEAFLHSSSPAFEEQNIELSSKGKGYNDVDVMDQESVREMFCKWWVEVQMGRQIWWTYDPFQMDAVVKFDLTGDTYHIKFNE